MNLAKDHEKPFLGPAEKPRPGGSQTLLTLTGERATFEGKFDVADSIEIGCEVRGELSVGGTLIVDEHGVVKADVRTVGAVIRGSFEGNISATGDIEIASTGRVVGDIKTDSLVIAKGALFEGHVARRTKEEAPAPAATVLPIQIEEWRLSRQ